MKQIHVINFQILGSYVIPTRKPQTVTRCKLIRIQIILKQYIYEYIILPFVYKLYVVISNVYSVLQEFQIYE